MTTAMKSKAKALPSQTKQQSDGSPKSSVAEKSTTIESQFEHMQQRSNEEGYVFLNTAGQSASPHNTLVAAQEALV